MIMSTLSIKKASSDVSSRTLLAVAAVLVCVLAFSGALLELVHRWNTQEEYSHGFLIPVISAWLLWARRDALRASVGQPSVWGPVLVLLALGMHIFGAIGRDLDSFPDRVRCRPNRCRACNWRLPAFASRLRTDHISAFCNSVAVFR